MQQWSLFEKIWLATFTAITLYLFYIWQDSVIALISSLSGMFCVVLVARGKLANYYYGIIQVVLYGYIAYEYRLYGEVMLNWFYYLPIQVIGILLWRNNPPVVSINYENIHMRRLTLRGSAYVVVSIVIGAVLYRVVLSSLGGANTWLDSLTTTLQVVAMLLMMWRYVEQWLLWITVNVLSIALWWIALAANGGNDYNILIMWVAFLINSLYGYWNWQRISKWQVARHV